MYKEQITFSDFEKLDMRIGTIVEARPFMKARNPSYILLIDFGDLGNRKSSAQITHRYSCSDLIGKQIVAIVNFPAKQIASIMSECLVLGAIGDGGDVVLLSPDSSMGNGLHVR